MKINFLPLLQMTALVDSCNTTTSVKNTGSECNDAMGVTAMFFLVPKTLRLDATDLLNIEDTFTTLIQGDAGARAYPIGGNSAPFVDITPSNEADVYETLPNGLQKFIRPGFINNVYKTINGGQCLYDAWRSFNATSFALIEVDINGQVRLKKYTSTTGVVTYGGLNATISVPSPDFATFTTVYKNNFGVSLNPTELSSAVIKKGGVNLLDLEGLYDVDVTSIAAASITVMHVKAQTDCAHTDLYDQYADELAVPSAWVVTDNATGAVVTLTAVAKVAGTKSWNLTGTFITAHTYSVNLATPTVLDGLNVDGFEGVTPAIIAIP